MTMTADTRDTDPMIPPDEPPDVTAMRGIVDELRVTIELLGVLASRRDGAASTFGSPTPRLAR